jgi:ABC-type nickel/cobalt efflux system permease component RcnA
MTWPEAVVAATSVAALGLIISVAIWQIFRTGRTAIRKERGSVERSA